MSSESTETDPLVWSRRDSIEKERFKEGRGTKQCMETHPTLAIMQQRVFNIALLLLFLVATPSSGQACLVEYS